MQLTDYQLEHLIFLVQTDLNGLNSTIKDYEEIIDASTFKKEKINNGLLMNISLLEII